MTKIDFLCELQNNGIDETLVCWDQSCRDDVFCVFYDNSKWTVYYQERGKKFDQRWFATESDALSYLLTKMR